MHGNRDTEMYVKKKNSLEKKHRRKKPYIYDSYYLSIPLLQLDILLQLRGHGLRFVVACRQGHVQVYQLLLHMFEALSCMLQLPRGARGLVSLLSSTTEGVMVFVCNVSCVCPA